MTLPLEQSMEREMTELTITLDPNGLWRRKRFEFCNALEDAMIGTTPDFLGRAWAELEKLGVRRSQSPNGEARSSVGKGAGE